MINYLKNLIQEVSYLFTKKPKLYEEDDERTFGIKAVAGEISRADLTDEDFSIWTNIAWIDQLKTDFCTGCSRAYAGYATEHVRLSWAGAFSVACRVIGYIPEFGQSILQIMKGARKYGTCEERLWEYKAYNPFKPKTTGRNYFANWNNIPKEAWDNAKEHKLESFFKVEIPYGWNKFNTFRAYLNKFKVERIAIQTGTDAHAVTLGMQKKFGSEIKLGGPDSYGEKSNWYRIGKSIDGIRWFSEWEVNQLFSGHMGLDMPKSLAEVLHKYTGKAVKGDSDECYLIKEGKKCHIPSKEVAWCFKIKLWEDITTITDEEINLVPEGEKLKKEDGQCYSLVNEIINTSNLNKL